MRYKIRTGWRLTNFMVMVTAMIALSSITTTTPGTSYSSKILRPTTNILFTAMKGGQEISSTNTSSNSVPVLTGTEQEQELKQKIRVLQQTVHHMRLNQQQDQQRQQTQQKERLNMILQQQTDLQQQQQRIEDQEEKIRHLNLERDITKQRIELVQEKLQWALSKIKDDQTELRMAKVRQEGIKATLDKLKERDKQHEATMIMMSKMKEGASSASSASNMTSTSNNIPPLVPQYVPLTGNPTTGNPPTGNPNLG